MVTSVARKAFYGFSLVYASLFCAQLMWFACERETKSSPSTTAIIDCGGEIPQPKLPVYWIDFSSLQGNQYEPPMKEQQQFESLQTVKGILPIRIAVDKTNSSRGFSSTAEPYTASDTAILQSHLTAIQKAYDDGHEIVLIVEDNVVLTKDFFENWFFYVKLAPRNWNVLQWHSSNDLFREQGRHFYANGDAWISWQPDHTSTKAYMITRRGMRQVLDGSGPLSLLVDEVIYYLAEKSYTFTNSEWIHTTTDAPSQPGLSNSTALTLDATRTHCHPYFQKRNESVLVLTNLRMKSELQVQKEIERLAEDVHALASSHSNTKWIVQTVITTNKLREVLARETAALPSFVTIQVQRNANVFNKFAMMEPLVDEMGRYDYVLLKDADQNLSGFPWNTYFSRKGDAMITGPLRETPEDSLRINLNRSKRQVFQLHEAQAWKLHSDFSPMISQIIPTAVPMIEMYFALMQADFAKWFFGQILTPEFTQQPCSWGPDLMWCGAAAAFAPNQTACHLIPVVSLHEDSQTIGVTLDADFQRKGMVAGTKFKVHPIFGKWMSYNYAWLKVINRGTPSRVVERCASMNNQTQARSEASSKVVFNLSECAKLAIMDIRPNHPGQKYAKFFAGRAQAAVARHNEMLTATAAAAKGDETSR
jgi:GR25 family glycosyltransferase involved in LPS biosynthesis